MTMAKRYQLTHKVDLSTPSDPTSYVAQGVVDLPILLSQRLQKNIRQGRVINIHSVKASLDTQGAGSDLDLGGAIVGEIRHCPATKNSAKAWRHLFAVWRKQKSQIVSGIGPSVRYDDFEIAFNSSFMGGGRTSTLYATGINDPTPEAIVMYGSSADGSHVSLEDTFESMQPQHEPSRFPISNNVVKASKYTSEFPNTVVSPFSCSWSAHDNQEFHDSGAQAQQPTTYIQDSASLCGVVYYQARMLPENVALTEQDDMTLELTFTVSIGMPLAKVPRRSKYRARMSRHSGYSKGNVRAKKGFSYSSRKKAAWRRYRK